MGLPDRSKSGSAPTQKVQTAQDWCDKRDALAKSGRHEEALQCFDKALELDPGYAKAWALKGATLGMLNRHERFSVCFREHYAGASTFSTTLTMKSISGRTGPPEQSSAVCLATTRKSNESILLRVVRTS